jgi:hypothetical protein
MDAIENPLQPVAAQFVAYLVSSLSVSTRIIVSPEQKACPFTPLLISSPRTPPVCISLCQHVFQGT